jgi:hypothetical protein
MPPDAPSSAPCLVPDAGECGLDLLLEAGDQFAVGGDQRLLGLELGDDLLLDFERRSIHILDNSNNLSGNLLYMM